MKKKHFIKTTQNFVLLEFGLFFLIMNSLIARIFTLVTKTVQSDTLFLKWVEAILISVTFFLQRVSTF